MTQSVWVRVDGVARNLSPFAFTLLLVIVAVIPIPVPMLSAIVPSFALIAVYFWVIHRPDLMPIWAVFLIGLFQDLLSGGRLGVSTIVLLLVWLTVVMQRRLYSGGSFMLLWAIFLPVAAGGHVLAWLLNSLVAGMLVDGGPTFFQYLTTIAAYPCIAWLFVQAHRSILQ